MSTTPLTWDINVTFDGKRLDEILDKVRAAEEKFDRLLDELDRLNLTEQKECV